MLKVRLNKINEMTIPGKHATFVFFKAVPINGGISFIANSGKDLDELENFTKTEVQDKLLKFLNKKFSDIFILDYSYKGAGYGFKIDIYKMVKKIS